MLFVQFALSESSLKVFGTACGATLQFGLGYFHTGDKIYNIGFLKNQFTLYDFEFIEIQICN